MSAFPFSAVVGQDAMKLALLLNAVNPRIGGVLVRGERGTAKSTAARGLTALLPEIEAVEGCACACDPHVAADACDDCRRRLTEQGTLSCHRRQAAFVDLPVSATEDRVVGSFDLEAALRQGLRRFQPGLLAAANRGVLYVDEVNLLDDHLVDLLLDVAATGVNIVEREGLAYRHPSRFILIGTMNPEEGELRPQLLDRFGLCVEVTAAASIDDRVAILDRCLAFDRDPDRLCAAWASAEYDLARRVAAGRKSADRVVFADADLRAIASLAAGLGAAGHRAELVILRAACALAALEDRGFVSDGDILRVAPLALRHRVTADGDLDAPAAIPDAQDLAARLEAARAEYLSGTTEKKRRR